MKAIHLIKAVQAAPIVSTLDSIGAPVEQLSILARMPLDAVREGRGVMGERSLWNFIELGAAHEDYRLLGFDSAQRNPITTLGEIGDFRMRLAPTLKRVFDYFIADVRSESTGTFYSLRPDTDGIWFRRLQMFGKDGASWQAEQYVIAMVIQIIRICAGHDWVPPCIRISSTARPQALPAEWSASRVVWGCEATEILIPADVLALPPVMTGAVTTNDAAHSQDNINLPPRLIDFVETQVRGKRTSLAEAAEETGLSIATLKRRLQQQQINYTDLVEQVRFTEARRLLQTSDISIADIADELGYEHPANFTRAFRRMTGLSPLAYRKQSGASNTG